MPNVFDYATPEEKKRLAEIDLVVSAGRAEKIRIYDRCRKRRDKEKK